MSEQEELPDAQAYATNTNANPAMGMGTYNLTFQANGGTTLNPNPTLLQPSGSMNYYVGDVTWQHIPPPAPWQAPVYPVQVVPSTTLTEDRVREIVREMFEQMIEPAAARISERVKQMIESMDEDE